MEFTSAGLYTGGPVEQHPALAGFASRASFAQKSSRRVSEAARLYAAVVSGREDPVFLREAMQPTHEVFVNYLLTKYPGLYGDPGGRSLGLRETMSVTDYQALYVDVLDRMYYGYYNAYPIVNKPLVKEHPLRDFRLVSRYLLDGVVSPFTSDDAAAMPQQRSLTGPVPQDGATQAAATTAPLQYQPKLWHAMTSVNWRAFVNDDLGIFKDLSNRLAIAANRGISKFITGMYFDANGPHASLYTTAYKNKIVTGNGASSSNPRLTQQGLADGFKILAGMVDSGGDPILQSGTAYLVHGPADTAAVDFIMNAASFNAAVEAGTQSSNFPALWLQVNNYLRAKVVPILDPYLPIVASGATTSWAIVMDPNAQVRPTVEFGVLNGFETPQLFTKVPNTQRMGGGVDPMMGDFFTMDQDMKIVSVFNALQIDGRATVGSNGSGA